MPCGVLANGLAAVAWPAAPLSARSFVVSPASLKWSNQLDHPRVAHAVIFVEADAAYDGRQHPVTDPLGMTVGQGLPDARYPLL